VQQLCDKLSDDYDSISKHVVIRNSKRRLGEIDVLAKKGERIDLYEVKCSYRIIKAKHQLKRIRKYLKFDNGYFYCGTSGMLLVI
jgi:hypothetical protein